MSSPEIIADRLLREFGVSATVGRPQVAFKETVLSAVSGELGTSARQAATASTGTSRSRWSLLEEEAALSS